MLCTLTLAMLCMLSVAQPANADEPAPQLEEGSEPAEAEKSTPVFTFGGHFVSVGHVRSDSDFDPSERYYDVDGQTEGQVATYFRPLLTVESDGFELRYEAELGWNVWSRNTYGLNSQFFSNGDGLALRHRQLWAGYSFNEETALKVGYQPLRDPSRLFLDHYAGALRVDFAWLGLDSAIWVAQLPDSTLEGITADGDNFLTDSFAFGFDNEWSCSGYTVDVNLYGLHDMRVVDQPLSLMTLVAGMRVELGALEIEGHVLGQLGQWSASGVGAIDQTILSWASQARVRHQLGAFDWSLGVVYLSGDDAEEGNGTLNAFLGSGKNMSPTTWLTEDEVRDRYDNLDEQIATSWGALFINRPGLALFDLSLGLSVTDWYAPRLVAAAALTSSPEHALGESFVGAEIGLHNRFFLGQHVRLIADLHVLVPGGAVAAFVNDVDRRATETAFGAQLGFLADF